MDAGLQQQLRGVHISSQDAPPSDIYPQDIHAARTLVWAGRGGATQVTVGRHIAYGFIVSDVAFLSPEAALRTGQLSRIFAAGRRPF
eukprot:1216577-Pyramimonas_sp.AAC.1